MNLKQKKQKGFIKLINNQKLTKKIQLTLLNKQQFYLGKEKVRNIFWNIQYFEVILQTKCLKIFKHIFYLPINYKKKNIFNWKNLIIQNKIDFFKLNLNL